MTKFRVSWLGGAVLPLALAAVGCGDASHEEAQSATTAWVTQHAERWEVDGTKGYGVTFDVAPCTNGRTMSRATTPRAEVELFFDCPENDVVDLAWLRAHSRGYDLVLNVPIDAPGWTFMARSPTSSVTEGLTFESWQDEKLAVLFETQMFAVAGLSHSPPCAQASMGADAPLPDSCWVDVPWEGTAVVHMDLPFGREWLRTPPPVRQ